MLVLKDDDVARGETVFACLLCVEVTGQMKQLNP